MILKELGSLAKNPAPLQLAHLPRPEPRPGEVVLRVSVCGVCHTELDEIEGRLPPRELPAVLGHQVVGRVAAVGTGSRRRMEDRVGVAWIHSACGACGFCRSGQENLCGEFKGTGKDVHGGYGEFMAVPDGFAHPIPESIDDAHAAPLLCAGAIGYRSLKLTGLADGQALGLTGFGASGHLVLKMVRHRYPASPVYVFARNAKERAFAEELGAVWTGDTGDPPPQQLQALIDTTPAWTPMAEGLKHLAPGGRLVINAIRKESRDREVLATLDYPSQLWMEKEIKSVANVTRADVREFLELAGQAGIRPQVEEYSLEQANEALVDLKHKRVRGAKVLRVALD